MKKTLLIVALIGFIAIGGYAQNTKNCTCKKKAVSHKIVKTHNRRTPQIKTQIAGPEKTLNCVPVNPDAVAEPCYGYRKDNIVVTECPGIFFTPDNKGVYEYSSDGTYLGYYPLSSNAKSGSNCSPGYEKENDLRAPQHTTIDHYKGPAPAGGNYGTKSTPQ